MTYQWHPENIIKTDQPEEWAGSCSYLVNSLVRTAQLALEYSGSGACTDEERISAAASTLEIAQALLGIVIDGTEALQAKAGAGLYRRDEA